MSLLRETLAKGCVRRLARGGWRRQTRVQNRARVTGRLWERHQTPSLEFTAASEDLLRWATAEGLALDVQPLSKGPETGADDLLFYMTMGRLG